MTHISPSTPKSATQLNALEVPGKKTGRHNKNTSTKDSTPQPEPSRKRRNNVFGEASGHPGKSTGGKNSTRNHDTAESGGRSFNPSPGGIEMVATPTQNSTDVVLDIRDVPVPGARSDGKSDFPFEAIKALLTQAASKYKVSEAPRLGPAAGSAAAATAVTFGVSPMLTTIAKNVFDGLGYGEVKVGTSDLSTVLSHVVGGAYVGLAHGPAGASLGAAVHEALGGAKSEDTSSSQMRREANQFLRSSLPLFAAFATVKPGGSAAATLLDSKISGNPFFKAFVSGLGSIVAAAVFGASSQALKNASPDTYRTKNTPKAPKAPEAETTTEASGKKTKSPGILTKAGTAFAAQTDPRNAGSFANAFLKTVAAPLGSIIADQVVKGMPDLLSAKAIANNPAAKAAIPTAISMAVFLTIWIAALHFASLVSGGIPEAPSDDGNSNALSDEDLAFVKQLTGKPGDSAIEDAPEQAGESGRAKPTADGTMTYGKFRAASPKDRTQYIIQQQHRLATVKILSQGAADLISRTPVGAAYSNRLNKYKDLKLKKTNIGALGLALQKAKAGVKGIKNVGAGAIHTAEAGVRLGVKASTQAGTKAIFGAIAVKNAGVKAGTKAKAGIEAGAGAVSNASNRAINEVRAQLDQIFSLMEKILKGGEYKEEFEEIRASFTDIPPAEGLDAQPTQAHSARLPDTRKLPESYRNAQPTLGQNAALPEGYTWYNPPGDGDCQYHCLQRYYENKGGDYTPSPTDIRHLTAEHTRGIDDPLLVGIDSPAAIADAIATPRNYTVLAEYGLGLAANALDIRVQLIQEDGRLTNINYRTPDPEIPGDTGDVGKEPHLILALAHDHYFLMEKEGE